MFLEIVAPNKSPKVTVAVIPVNPSLGRSGSGRNAPVTDVTSVRFGWPRLIADEDDPSNNANLFGTGPFLDFTSVVIFLRDDADVRVVLLLVIEEHDNTDLAACRNIFLNFAKKGGPSP